MKNEYEKQEEFPAAEEVTISLEEYSKKKKRLQERGCLYLGQGKE